VWWCIPITLPLEMLRQKDHEFEASLAYIVRPWLQKKKKKPKNKIFFLKVHIHVERERFSKGD
jgi:hypothetical protein